MSESKKSEKPVSKQEVMRNVTRWRVQHQLERPQGRQRFENRINGLETSVKGGAK